MLLDGGMLCQHSERGTRSHLQSLFRGATDTLQGCNASQTDQYRWGELASFHVWIKVGTARDEHSLLAFLYKHLRGFIETTRGEVAKWWKSQHQDTPLFAAIPASEC